MSKAKPVYDAISDIKDEYINDAMQQSAPKKNGNFRYVLEAVACVVIVCGFVALSFVLRSVSGPVNTGVGTEETTEQETTELMTEQETTERMTEQEETEQITGTEEDPVIVTDTEYVTENSDIPDNTAAVTDDLPGTEESDNGIETYKMPEDDGPSLFDMLDIKPLDTLLPTILHGRLQYTDQTLNWLNGEEGEDAPLFFEGVLVLDTQKALASMPDELRDQLKDRYPEIDPAHSYPTLTIRVYNKENAEKDLHYIDLQEKRDYDFKYLQAGEEPFDSYIDKALFKPDQLWVGAVKSRITDKGFHMYIECGDHIVEYKYTWDDRNYVRSLEPIDGNLCIMITSSRYISSRIDRSKIEEDPSPVKELRRKVIELDTVLDIIRKRPYNHYYSSIESAIISNRNPDKYNESSPYMQWDYIVHGTEKLLQDYIRSDDVVEYVRVSARYRAVFYYKEMPDGEIYCSLIYRESTGGAAFDELTVENVCSNAVPLAEFEQATGIKFDFRYDQAKIAEYLDIIYSHPETTKTTHRLGDTSLEDKDQAAQKRLEELGVDEYYYVGDQYGHSTEYTLRCVNTSYIMYRSRSYPMEYELYGNNKSTLTNIMMRGEELKICGISSESSFDEFEEVFTSLGFEVTRAGVNITASACEGGLTVRLVKQYENNGETVPSKLYFTMQTITRGVIIF
ncbi:MAG: hypothetical protein IKH51_06375 [Clostridia bacterium]|nr:hypothetical protein [Clostridia bacterium]